MFQKLVLKFFVLFFIVSGALYSQDRNAARIKYCDSLITAGRLKSDQNDYLKSLELLTEAHEIAEKYNLPKQLSHAKNNIGANYFALFDYGEALKYYLDAYTIAFKTGDVKHEVMVLNNIAILYGKKKDFKKAHDYFKKAYDYSVQEKDSVQVGIYALNLGLVMNEMKNFGKSRSYLDEALLMSKKLPDLHFVVQGAIAENELEMGNAATSRSMVLTLLDKVPVKKDNQNAIMMQLIVAKTYLKEHNYDYALRYTAEAFRNNNSLETKRTIYEIMADIYSQSKKYPEALRYKDSVFSIQRELDEIENGRVFENTRVKFEIQDYKNQIGLNKATIAKDRKLFYSIVAAMAAVLLMLFFIFRNRAMKHRQKELIAKNNQQLLELELAKKESEALVKEQQYMEEQHEILLEQERLKNEVEYKNRQLSSKALYLSGKNQLIEDIIGQISSQPEVAGLPAIRNHMRYLKNSLKEDNEWENFLTHFEEVNQGFLTRLKSSHLNLTANDIRFICYVYMNLTSKEIASMLNISLDACRKRKERVAQKLGLADSTTLYPYLQEI